MRFRKLKQQNKNNKINIQEDKPKYTYAPYAYRIKALITDMFMIYMPIMFATTYLIMGGKEEMQNSQLAPFVAVSLYALIYAFFVSAS